VGKTQEEAIMRQRRIPNYVFTDPAYHEDPRDRLIKWMRRIEEYREELDGAGKYFRWLIDTYPEAAKLWGDFVRLGGTTSAELDQLRRGKLFRAKRMRHKRHMRLVSVTGSFTTKRKAHAYVPGTGDDAA
jgi:hypothetical protein